LKRHYHTIKVYYKDVDKMGIVYYSRYFEYFEESRTELLFSLGICLTGLEKKGIMVPVISSHCDYKKGAKLEDTIIIKSWIERTPRSTLKIFYEAKLKKTNDLIATGYTVHVFINREWKVIKPPDNFLNILKK
tara:strand:- start:1811 stop:2209 length:399 start_codon:yes stop_codon:yes gene_type:complete